MFDTQERRPFESIGDKSRRQMILEGFATLPPLEAGTRITFEQISEWLGEPFPFARDSGRFIDRDYGPMDEVREDLLSTSGVVLLAETNVGYRVATDVEKMKLAELRSSQAADRLGQSMRVARAVNPERVDHATAIRAKEIEDDARQQQAAIRAAARHRARQARLYGSGDAA